MTPHAALPPIRDFTWRLAVVHGGFWIVTGLWPVLHRPTFEWVIGPRVDYWVVQTVGALAAVIGLVLILAVRRNRLTPEILLLAVAAPVVLATVELVYLHLERIRNVYIADAILEIAFAVGWLIVAWRRRIRADPDGGISVISPIAR